MTGIVFLLDLEYAPFVNRYRDILENINEKYEIITWNRMKETNSDSVISFNKKSQLGDNIIKKAIGFIQYSWFLNKTLREKQYDKLIVLTTLTGFLAYKSLMGRYKGKYIFDIRDYTYEKNIIFKSIESKIIRNSRFTVISSRGFLAFLPKSEKYIVCHNFLPEETKRANTYIGDGKYFSMPDGKIVISFIGAVRHLQLDKRMIDIFGNDDRFILYFHGYGVAYEELKAYVDNKAYKNVILTGKYDRKEKDKLMLGVSLINGYYEETKIANTTAVSNKYYDSMIYKVPFWGNPKCFVGHISEQNGIGVCEYLDADIKEKIVERLRDFNYSEFIENCEKTLSEIIAEDQDFTNTVESFINDHNKQGN